MYQKKKKKKKTPNRTLSFTMCYLDLVSTLTPFIQWDRPKALILIHTLNPYSSFSAFIFPTKGYEGQYVVD